MSKDDAKKPLKSTLGEAVFDHEPYLPFHLLCNRNGITNIVLLCIATYLAWSKLGSLFFVIPIHVCMVLFIDFFKFGVPLKFPGYCINVFDDNLRTATFYEYMKLAAERPHSEGVDLGFNLYEGDYTRTPAQAQLKKFEFAFKEMGLEEGMRVLDIGCGFGDWLYWLKNTKKCSVMGINMTHGQADVVEGRGIKCLRGTWQSFHASQEFTDTYGGQFDAVSAWDTIEHYVKGKDIYNIPVIHNTYRNLFELAKRCIDPKTKAGVFWTSTLHRCRWLRRDWSTTMFKEWFNCYLMCITYAGCYPGRLEWSSLSGRAKPDFELWKEFDKIEDYRMTSLICKNHFGNFEMNTRSIRYWLSQPVFFLASPHFLMVTLNLVRKETAWMWHVGGIEKERAADCPCQLLWQCYKTKK